MRYNSGYTKKSGLYYVSIFENGSCVTITFDTYESQHKLMIILDDAWNKKVDKLPN
jgi:hypothetical protein